MKKIKVFIHLIDLFENYKEISDELVDNIISSGLISAATEINIYYHYKIGIDNFKWLKDKLSIYPNVKFISGKAMPKDYEIPTVMEVRTSAVEDPEEFYALYLHHKGVSYENEPEDSPNADFRRLLEYFNIQQWRECIEALDRGYDVSGVNWWDAYGAWHFPGNFWWAKSSYLKTLPELVPPHTVDYKRQLTVGSFDDEWYRAEAEVWIGLNNPKAYSIYRWSKSFQPGWTAIKPEEYRT